MNLHQILCEAGTFLHGSYLDDSEGCRYGQPVTGNFIMTTRQLMHHVSCRVFTKTLSHPGHSAPLQPRFGVLWHRASPKTKITFEMEEISDSWWDSGKYNGATDGNWENCVRSQGAYFEATEASSSCVQCFLYLVSSSINVSIFHITSMDTFQTDLIYHEILWECSIERIQIYLQRF